MAAVHDGYVLQKVLRVFVLLWSAQVAIGRVWFHHGCHPSTTSVCSLVREIDTRDRTLFFDIRRWIGYSTIGNWRRGTYRLSSTNAGSQRHQSEFLYLYMQSCWKCMRIFCWRSHAPLHVLSQLSNLNLCYLRHFFFAYRSDRGFPSRAKRFARGSMRFVIRSQQIRVMV